MKPAALRGLAQLCPFIVFGSRSIRPRSKRATFPSPFLQRDADFSPWKLAKRRREEMVAGNRRSVEQRLHFLPENYSAITHGRDGIPTSYNSLSGVSIDPIRSVDVGINPAKKIRRIGEQSTIQEISVFSSRGSKDRSPDNKRDEPARG